MCASWDDTWDEPWAIPSRPAARGIQDLFSRVAIHGDSMELTSPSVQEGGERVAILQAVTLPGHRLDMVVTFLNDVVLFRSIPFRSDTRAHTRSRSRSFSQTSVLNLGAAMGAAEESGHVSPTTCRSLLPGPPNSTCHPDAPHATKGCHIKIPVTQSLRLARLQRMKYYGHELTTPPSPGRVLRARPRPLSLLRPLPPPGSSSIWCHNLHYPFP